MTYIYTHLLVAYGPPEQGQPGVTRGTAKMQAGLRRLRGQEVNVWRTPLTAGNRNQDWKLVRGL